MHVNSVHGTGLVFSIQGILPLLLFLDTFHIPGILPLLLLNSFHIQRIWLFLLFLDTFGLLADVESAPL